MKILRYLLCLLLGGLTVACSQTGLDGVTADGEAPAESYHAYNPFSKDATAVDLAQIRQHVNEALSDLNNIDLTIDDGHVKKARADAITLLADLASAEKNAQIHPEPSSSQTIAAIKSALPLIKFPVFVPSGGYSLPDRNNFFSYPLELSLQNGSEIIGLTFAQPNAQGLLMGADGKLLNVYLLTAAVLLNETSRESSELFPDSPNESSIDDLGDYRLKVTTDLAQMGSDILASIIYVHDHVTPPNDLPKPMMVYSIVNGVVYAQNKPMTEDDLLKSAETTNSPTNPAKIYHLSANPTIARMTVSVTKTPAGTSSSTKPAGGRSIQFLGEVISPGWVIIPREKTLTLASAVEQAKGPTRDARGYVTITRNMPDGTTLIFNDVNLLKVLNKTGADFALQDGDLIALGESLISNDIQ